MNSREHRSTSPRIYAGETAGGRRADVEIVPAARALPEIPLLVAFGWFLFVMLEQDAGAVVVTG